MTKEQVIQVRNEKDPAKVEELIGSYAFDAMYAIQEGVDSIFLKSQGFSINLCADLALEIDKRLKHQSIPAKMKIYLNSRFPKEKYHGKAKDKKNSFDNPRIISYLDIKFQFPKNK
ncbi:MAG: hypothetical protein EU530_05975 [Promethearchaeota archaeon]|nr:MAG: hypothetical protein EU530_05975 [Candidatus Lokiarchaeota archaeon]